MDKKKEYLYGLDYLRVLSTVAVLIYHINPDLLPGGFLAVCVFLVLHGYLFVVSNSKKEKFSVILYWLKRIFRLYLPMAAVVALSIYALRYATEIIWLNEKPETMSVLECINNWWQINAGQSYFARLTNSPFTHMWYISMLLQVEVVLPVFYKIYRWLKGHANFWLGWVAFVLLTIISMTVMPYLKLQNAPEMRLYFGTDARLFSILLGMCLGFLHVHNRRLNIKLFKYPVITELLFIGGAYGLIWMCLNISEQSPLYDYSFIMTSLLTVLLIALCTNKDYPLFRHLWNPPVKWLSAISYEVYLIHYPLLFYALSLTGFDKQTQLYYVGAVIAGAFLLHFAFSIRFRKDWKVIVMDVLKVAVLVPIVLGSFYGAQDIIAAKDHSEEMAQLEDELAQNADMMEQMQEEYLKKRQEEMDLMNDPKAMAKEVNAAKLPVTGIGDSVMLGALEDLYKTFPKGDFDAKQNRSYYPLYDIVQTRSKDKTLGNPVVIGIGTNAVTPIKTMREIVKMCGDRYVYWLTITNNWQFNNNDNIKKVAKEFDNVVCIDWEAHSKGHSDWFYSDGIHLTPKGRKAYSNYILECISRDLVSRKMAEEKDKLIMGIGDGFMLTALNGIRENVEDLYVICEEDLDFASVQESIQVLKDSDAMPTKIFISVGNDQTISVEDLQQLFESVKGKKVILIKTPVRKDNETNAHLDEVLQNYPDVQVFSWEDMYKEHPEYFTPDRVHLNDEGSEKFAQFILEAISTWNTEEKKSGTKKKK